MVTFMLVVLIACSGFMFASLMSFLGVVAERTARNESILGRSHCGCGRALAWYENVPVLGWLRVRGRTRCCDTGIPPALFYTECAAFIAGIVCALVWIPVLNMETDVSIALPVVATCAMLGVLAIEYAVLHWLARRTSAVTHARKER